MLAGWVTAGSFFPARVTHASQNGCKNAGFSNTHCQKSLLWGVTNWGGVNWGTINWGRNARGGRVGAWAGCLAGKGNPKWLRCFFLAKVAKKNFLKKSLKMLFFFKIISASKKRKKGGGKGEKRSQIMCSEGCCDPQEQKKKKNIKKGGFGAKLRPNWSSWCPK